MAHPLESRLAVRRSYVMERLPLEAAAEKHGIGYNTARLWKKKGQATGDDWDRARAASRMAMGGLGDLTAQVLEDFAGLFQLTMEDIRNGEYDGLKKAEALSRLSDAYAKTMKAAGGGDPKLAKLAIALEVLEELTKFLREEYPQHLATFAQLLEPFGARVSEAFG
ncbi:MAG: DUF1804 family protein [Gammaproteobacteria bacterium]|nr:DUF1804 family protein [Gammaproteobacteria bacterium]